jgi:hypothetical protein
MNAEESEISVLDLLLVVAENLKLLILGPILVGLLALAGAYLVPQSYTSQAILALPTATAAAAAAATQAAAAMMVSPLVLDSIIESLNLSEGRSTQGARVGLANQIKAAVGKDGLLRLDVTAHSPAQAQTIANAVIDTWLKSTVPGEQARADLEKRLSYAQTSLDAVTRLISRLDAGGAANLNKPLTRGEAGTSFVGLGELQSRYLGDVLSIPRELQGLSRDVVKQPPTLPTEPVSPKKGLIAALAAIAAGFVLLLWVFMRQAWRRATQDARMAEKCRRLAAALS